MKNDYLLEIVAQFNPKLRGIDGLMSVELSLDEHPELQGIITDDDELTLVANNYFAYLKRTRNNKTSYSFLASNEVIKFSYVEAEMFAGFIALKRDDGKSDIKSRSKNMSSCFIIENDSHKEEVLLGIENEGLFYLCKFTGAKREKQLKYKDSNLSLYRIYEANKNLVVFRTKNEEMRDYLRVCKYVYSIKLDKVVMKVDTTNFEVSLVKSEIRLLTICESPYVKVYDQNGVHKKDINTTNPEIRKRIQRKMFASPSHPIIGQELASGDKSLVAVPYRVYKETDDIIMFRPKYEEVDTDGYKKVFKYLYNTRLGRIVLRISDEDFDVILCLNKIIAVNLHNNTVFKMYPDGTNFHKILKKVPQSVEVS